MIDQAQPRTMQVPGAGLIPQGRPSVDYKEYPKMMTHPQYQPGKPSEPIKHPSGFTYYGIGTPVRFPHVLVKTQRDEEYHAAQGYVSQGKCDAAAFDRAVGAGQIPDQVAYKPLEYPKWVQGKLCQNKEQEDAWIIQCAPVAEVEPVPLTTEQIVDKVVAEVMAAELEETPAEKRARLLRELAALDGVDTVVPVEAIPTKADIEAGHAFVTKKKAAPKKKKKAAAPLNQEQKNARSEAIKAGMARRRAAQAAEPAVDPIPDAQR